MKPERKKSPDWSGVHEICMLIPGPRDAHPRDLLSAYLSMKSGVQVAEDLVADVIDELERRLPLHVTVSVRGRGEKAHPMHGVHVLAPDGTRHPDVTGALSGAAHDLIRAVLDLLIGLFRGYGQVAA